MICDKKNICLFLKLNLDGEKSAFWRSGG